MSKYVNFSTEAFILNFNIFKSLLYAFTDIEEQLGLTENRCNSLKEQLNYMKRYCIDSNKYETYSINQGCTSNNKWKRTSYTMINDPSDPNVKAINNILTGLSNSVNRLSALHSDIDSKQTRHISKKSYREIACGNDEGM